MAISSPTLLYLPGEDQRELWRRESNGRWTRVEGHSDSSSAVQAIEMVAFDSSPFFAMNVGDGQASLEGAVALRWESLGVEVEPPGKIWTYWEVAKEHERVVLGSLALHWQDLPSEMLHRSATAFEPSISLYPLPADHLIIYKELGRYVVAFMSGKRLLHGAVLTSRHLNSHAITEIQQLFEALRSSLLLAGLKGVQVWTEISATFASSLQQALGIQVHAAAKPAPELPLESSDLLPPTVAQARVEHQKLRRQWRLAALALSLVLLAFGAWVGALLLREQKLSRQLATIEARRPEVESARNAQLRWMALEEAVSPDHYPIEVFHQLVSLLPPEGIRFKEFSMNQDTMVISGEASSLIHASKFQNDVKNSQQLQRYAFNAPQPTVLDDSRATFRIEGTLNAGSGGATTDAAQ